MTEPAKVEKVVVRREVLIDADFDNATVACSPEDIDLSPEESLLEFLDRQGRSGESVADFVREMDLLEGVSVLLQVVEHYEDGSHRCTDRATWKDEE